MKRRAKKTAFWGLCGTVLIACIVSFEAPAADLSETGSPLLSIGGAGSMDDQTRAYLQDNVITFEELGDLVQYYNPSYQQLLGSVMPMVDAGKETASQMRSSDTLEMMKESRTELLKAMSEMDPNAASPVEQMAYQQTSAMFQAVNTGIRGTEQGIKAISKASGSIEDQTRDLRAQTLYSLTSAVQQMFIGYHQALASRDLCLAAAELSEAAEQSAETQRSVGMATDNDVLSAQQALLSAQNQIISLDNTLASLRQNLYLMTGFSYDATVEIGEVPAPDLTKIDAMNPAVDITRAINNSYSLKTLDDTLKNSKAGYLTKEERKKEAEDEIRMQLEALYQTVLTNRAAYEAASTTSEAAALAEESSRRQYELGLIGRLQYLQTKAASLQQKMAVDNASLALSQAILDYEWALKGIILSEETTAAP